MEKAFMRLAVIKLYLNVMIIDQLYRLNQNRSANPKK